MIAVCLAPVARDGVEEEVIAEDYDEHGTSDLQQNYVHNKHGGKLVTEDTKAVSCQCTLL